MKQQTYIYFKKNWSLVEFSFFVYDSRVWRKCKLCSPSTERIIDCNKFLVGREELPFKDFPMKQTHKLCQSAARNKDKLGLFKLDYLVTLTIKFIKTYWVQ